MHRDFGSWFCNFMAANSFNLFLYTYTQHCCDIFIPSDCLENEMTDGLILIFFFLPFLICCVFILPKTKIICEMNEIWTQTTSLWFLFLNMSTLNAYVPSDWKIFRLSAFLFDVLLPDQPMDCVDFSGCFWSDFTFAYVFFFFSFGCVHLNSTLITCWWIWDSERNQD